jgi:phage terminase small subunit
MKEQYKIFCDTYLQTFNASTSYAKAFPAAKEGTCMVNGCKLLKRQEIQEYLKERFKELGKENIAKIEEILEYYTKGVRGELKEEVVVTEMVGDGLSETKIVMKQIAIKDRTRCAELLMKRLELVEEDRQDNTFRIELVNAQNE